MSFEHKIALESKSKVKSFWNYINSKLKTRSGIGTLERSDGTLASSEADKVEVLNTFFAWPDGLHSKVLFEVHDSIYYPLYLFFNKSIEEGNVPAEWEKAIVSSPIFKKGKKSSPCNDRPVL